MLDARAGLRQGDAEVAEILRRADMPVVVVANKVDGPADEPHVADLYRLGLGDPMPVSATQGRGTGDLLDRLVGALRRDGDRRPGTPTRQAAAGGDRPAERRQVLAGQPFLGAERVIVSEIAGTTRDAIDTELRVGERDVLLVDTAGLRKRSRSRARSTTTRRSAPSAPPSAPTSRSWSATRRRG